MSNKKIDLKQFEGITKGKWEIIDLPGGGIDIGVRYTNHGHTPVINFTQRMGEQVRQIERDVADMNAIAAVPDLIAALKESYERIDSLEERIEWMEHVSSGIHEEDWANQVREWLECAHPSKWCSWGDCPKCASE